MTVIVQDFFFKNRVKFIQIIHTIDKEVAFTNNFSSLYLCPIVWGILVIGVKFTTEQANKKVFPPRLVIRLTLGRKQQLECQQQQLILIAKTGMMAGGGTLVLQTRQIFPVKTKQPYWKVYRAEKEEDLKYFGHSGWL